MSDASRTPPDIGEISVALDVLMRLSERSNDRRLRDAIAAVRSALHDELECSDDRSA